MQLLVFRKACNCVLKYFTASLYVCVCRTGRGGGGCGGGLRWRGVVVVVALLFYVHGKHLRSCRDGQLT